jgi:hypothetical protein
MAVIMVVIAIGHGIVCAGQDFMGHAVEGARKSLHNYY